MLQSVWKNPIHFLAFGFGSGTLPKAPGTWGTLIAVPIYFAISEWNWAAYAILVIIMAVFGIAICGKTADDLHVPDHPGIVWDEIVGYLITMFMAPKGWLWVAIGFVLFRLFDIVKPFPIRWLDRRLPGGLGIMADDWLAGVFAWLGLQGCALFLVTLF